MIGAKLNQEAMETTIPDNLESLFIQEYQALKKEHEERLEAQTKNNGEYCPLVALGRRIPVYSFSCLSSWDLQKNLDNGQLTVEEFQDYIDKLTFDDILDNPKKLSAPSWNNDYVVTVKKETAGVVFSYASDTRDFYYAVIPLHGLDEVEVVKLLSTDFEEGGWCIIDGPFTEFTKNDIVESIKTSLQDSLDQCSSK